MTDPNSYALATLLWARRNDSDTIEAISEAIAGLFPEWSDERKADLYALLAEKIDPNSTFLGMVYEVDHCLTSHREYFGA